MPWEIRHIDELDGDLAAKPLIEDPDTGMSVMKMKYIAGFTNEWHTHNCAHGMYVLDGILKTHAGSFGPGRAGGAPRVKEELAGQGPARSRLGVVDPPLPVNFEFAHPVRSYCGSSENQPALALGAPMVAGTGRPGGKGQSPVVPREGFKKRQEVDPAWPQSKERHEASLEGVGEPASASG